MSRPLPEFLTHAKMVRLHIAANPGITRKELYKEIKDAEYSLWHLKRRGLVRCEGSPIGNGKWFVVAK